jgi:hypothetical protein
MIFYRPTDGDVHTGRIEYRPRTCFLMTRLGRPIPHEIEEIRLRLTTFFSINKINVIDANTEITGRDFLLKIWHIILGVPLGIAIITRNMSAQTFANIFYEIGLMQAYGKETLIIKTVGTKVPSDFVRTEHIQFADDFEEKLDNFLQSFFKQAEYYKFFIADQVENKNPLLAIDYLKRAYLISGEEVYREEAIKIFQKASIKERAKNSVEMLLIDFCSPPASPKKDDKRGITPVAVPAVMESTMSLGQPYVIPGKDAQS